MRTQVASVVKKTLATTLFTSLAFSSMNAMADGHYQLDHQWDVSVFGSYIDPDSDRRDVRSGQELGEDWGISGALGYRFSEKLAGRLIIGSWDLAESVKAYGIDALFSLNDDWLYLIAGYKHHDFDSQDDDAINLGLGKRFVLNEDWFFTAEVLGIRSVVDSYTDLGANLGLTYAWGGKPAPLKASPAPVVAPPPPPMDSDGDGVYDDKDNCPGTEADDAVDAMGCSVYEMVEDSIELLVNFANNSDKVEDRYLGEIQRVADFMIKYPDTTVVIEGHTSAKGPAAYNKTLSSRRAKNVAMTLVERFGIDQQRVDYQGHGEEQLLDDADTQQAHQRNRRIVGVVSVAKKVKVKR